ncbi:MAG: hypothetical protein Kow0022_12910 [Phycisphaerales bacterium]
MCQTRIALPLDPCEKFGKVILLVAADDWKPLDPRYELRSVETLEAHEGGSGDLCASGFAGKGGCSESRTHKSPEQAGAAGFGGV